MNRWIIEDIETNTYECPECGLLWQLINGTPKENNMHHCPQCGSKIISELKDE